MESIRLWPNGAPYAQGGNEEDQPFLTPYLLENEPAAPAVIVCPGGGYHMKAQHEGEPVARWLNTLGIASFVLQYRVAPYRQPIPLLDAQRAIRLLRSRASDWRIDPARIGILGFSAGGHLAACAGTLFDNGQLGAEDPIERVSSRPDLMILCYPVISMAEYAPPKSKENLLGPEPSAEWVERYSCQKQVTGNTPPAFIWFTADDGNVPVENGMMMASALSRQKVPFELHIFESGRHGLGLAQEHPEAKMWTSLCERWLKRQEFERTAEDR